MEVVIKGEAKEVAVLVVAMQGRQWSKDELEAKLAEVLSEASKGYDAFQYS